MISESPRHKSLVRLLRWLERPELHFPDELSRLRYEVACDERRVSMGLNGGYSTGAIGFATLGIVSAQGGSDKLILLCALLTLVGVLLIWHAILARNRLFNSQGELIILERREELARPGPRSLVRESRRRG